MFFYCKISDVMFDSYCYILTISPVHMANLLCFALLCLLTLPLTSFVSPRSTNASYANIFSLNTKFAISCIASESWISCRFFSYSFLTFCAEIKPPSFVMFVLNWRHSRAGIKFSIWHGWYQVSIHNRKYLQKTLFIHGWLWHNDILIIQFKLEFEFRIESYVQRSYHLSLRVLLKSLFMVRY